MNKQWTTERVPAQLTVVFQLTQVWESQSKVQSWGVPHIRRWTQVYSKTGLKRSRKISWSQCTEESGAQWGARARALHCGAPSPSCCLSLRLQLEHQVWNQKCSAQYTFTFLFASDPRLPFAALPLPRQGYLRGWGTDLRWHRRLSFGQFYSL